MTDQEIQEELDVKAQELLRDLYSTIKEIKKYGTAQPDVAASVSYILTEAMAKLAATTVFSTDLRKKDGDEKIIEVFKSQLDLHFHVSVRNYLESLDKGAGK